MMVRLLENPFMSQKIKYRHVYWSHPQVPRFLSLPPPSSLVDWRKVLSHIPGSVFLKIYSPQQKGRKTLAWYVQTFPIMKIVSVFFMTFWYIFYQKSRVIFARIRFKEIDVSNFIEIKLNFFDEFFKNTATLNKWWCVIMSFKVG